MENTVGDFLCNANQPGFSVEPTLPYERELLTVHWHRITSLRSVFLFPTTGYLTKERKSAFCCRITPFSCTSVPYERELSTVHWHTKKAQPHGCAFAFFRDPDRIRTCDPQLRRLLLYPAELPDQSKSGCKDND